MSEKKKGVRVKLSPSLYQMGVEVTINGVRLGERWLELETPLLVKKGQEFYIDADTLELVLLPEEVPEGEG